MPKFRPLSETKFINDANLVSYWKLDGNSNDSKGSNNGTDTAVTYSTSNIPYPNFGQGASLNGSTSQILINNATTFSNISVSGWFKTSDTGRNTMLFTVSNTDGVKQFDINILTDNKLACSVYTGTVYRVSTTFTVNDGLWHFFVSIKNGTTISLYVDGKFIGSTTGPTVNVGGTSWLIGNHSATNWCFNGQIDDVAIYNRAISASEVNELYQGMTNGEYLGDGVSQTELQNTDLRNDSSLVSYWRMEGNSNDSKGSNNGTDTAITYVPGRFGQCASFNGSSSKIALATATDLKPTGIFSVTGWFTNNGYTGINMNNILQSYSQVSTVAGFEIGIEQTTNLFRFVVGNNTGTTVGTQWQEAKSSVTYNDGVWRHFACVYDGTKIYLYINSVLVSSPNWSNGLAYTATSYQRIGCQNLTGTDASFYNGKIDDLALHNGKALTQAEINSLYRIGSTKLLLHLNGNSTDSSGNNNNGTDTAITYVDGKFGKCASFNGSSSYISTPTGSRITANGTISCWFKTTSTAAYQEIFGNETTNEYHRVSMNATGQIGVYILTGGVEKVNLTSTQTYRDGLWHHLVMRWGTGGMKIYVDNVNILSSADTSYGNGTVGIQIGVNYNNGTRVWYFNGLIDEFIFDNVGWTPQEVAKYYSYAKGYYATL